MLFLVCHAVGLRSYTCVLCGQAPSGDATDVLALGLGCLYVLAYFLFVVGSPTLALASVIFRVFEKLFSAWASPSPAPPAALRG